VQTISTTDEQTTSADKKAISASKKTISADDPGGQTAAVSSLLFVFIFFLVDVSPSVEPVARYARSLTLPWCECGGGARDLGLGPGETPYATSALPLYLVHRFTAHSNGPAHSRGEI
jgi:hypothetical protein